MTKVLEISNCWECPNKSVQPDPDPYDWFCDDDEKVVCKLTGTIITQACRPHQTQRDCKESEIPENCPLKTNKS